MIQGIAKISQVEMEGYKPLTSWMQTERSPNRATFPQQSIQYRSFTNDASFFTLYLYCSPNESYILRINLHHFHCIHPVRLQLEWKDFFRHPFVFCFHFIHIVVGVAIIDTSGCRWVICAGSFLRLCLPLSFALQPEHERLLIAQICAERVNGFIPGIYVNDSSGMNNI